MVQNTDPELTTTRARQCFGLIGGLGVAATVRYYETLAAALQTAHRPLNLVMAHADVRYVFEQAQQRNFQTLADYLLMFLQQVESAGATFAALPAVLPHICIAELSPKSPLPLISLLEVVRDDIRKRGVRRVAVFGTRFAVQSNLFGSLDDLDVVKPRPEELDRIHGAYSSLVFQGKGSSEIRDELLALANTMVVRERAEVIVLAGTDFSLVFNEKDTPFPALDCAEAHIRAILRAMGSELN